MVAPTLKFWSNVCGRFEINELRIGDDRRRAGVRKNTLSVGLWPSKTVKWRRTAVWVLANALLSLGIGYNRIESCDELSYKNFFKGCDFKSIRQNLRRDYILKGTAWTEIQVNVLYPYPILPVQQFGDKN